MASKKTFPYSIRYVRNDQGDIVLLPEPQEVAALRTKADELRRELESKRKELSALCSSANATRDANAKATATSAVTKARERVDALSLVIEEMSGQAERMERVREHYLPESSEYLFELRRYGWNEREESRTAARVIDEDGSSTVDQAAFVIALLESCIESWNIEEPITQDAIKGIDPPLVIDKVYQQIRSRTEASIDSLPFPGTAVDGRPGGASG